MCALAPRLRRNGFHRGSTSRQGSRTGRTGFVPHLPARGSVGEESVLRTITGFPAPSQHHESAPLLLCEHPQPHFRSGARSRRVRSREVHTGPCPKQSSDVAGVPRPACRPGFFLDASSMTRGVRPPFRRWMGLSDQQSTCAKVSIGRLHEHWCGAPLPMGIARTRPCDPCSHPRWSSYLFWFRGPFEWTCACHHVRVFPGTAPGTFVFNLFSYGT